MSPRWMIERKRANNDHEILRVIEIYKEDENKELVKLENKQWSYKRELLLVEGRN